MAMRRPDRPSQLFSFTDPNQPGAIWEIELRSLDAIDFPANEEIANAFWRGYVTGEGGKPPVKVFPPIQGEAPNLTYGLVQQAAIIFNMQVATGDNRYDMVDLIAFATNMPCAWVEVNMAADKLTLAGPLGKAVRDLAQGSSESPSSTPSNIPSQSLSNPSSSGQSMNASEVSQD